jgi:hypothetical protein
MKTEQIIFLIISFFLGMLLLNMVKTACACDVTEGFRTTNYGGDGKDQTEYEALTTRCPVLNQDGIQYDVGANAKLCKPTEYCKQGPRGVVGAPLLGTNGAPKPFSNFCSGKHDTPVQYMLNDPDAPKMYGNMASSPSEYVELDANGEQTDKSGKYGLPETVCVPLKRDIDQCWAAQITANHELAAGPYAPCEVDAADDVKFKTLTRSKYGCGPRPACQDEPDWRDKDNLTCLDYAQRTNPVCHVDPSSPGCQTAGRERGMNYCYDDHPDDGHAAAAVDGRSAAHACQASCPYHGFVAECNPPPPPQVVQIHQPISVPVTAGPICSELQNSIAQRCVQDCTNCDPNQEAYNTVVAQCVIPSGLAGEGQKARDYMSTQCGFTAGDVLAQTSGGVALPAGEPELTATHTLMEQNMVGLSSTTTYQLFISGESTIFSNVYVMYGSSEGDLFVPGAYTVQTPFGVNVGGVASEILAAQPNREAPDSWLTVGRLNDQQIAAGTISSIGIDWANWGLHGQLKTDNGAVFWMDPDQGPKFGNPGEGAEPDGSILVGQITLPDDAVDEQRQVVMNFQGRSVAMGGDWQREGVTWNLPPGCPAGRPTCVPADVFTQRCGPEIQTNCCCD